MVLLIKYANRADALQSCPEDRPLIVQFCANDPEVVHSSIGQQC